MGQKLKTLIINTWKKEKYFEKQWRWKVAQNIILNNIISFLLLWSFVSRKGEIAERRKNVQKQCSKQNATQQFFVPLKELKGLCSSDISRTVNNF